jgi:hypothetical protein
VKSQDLQFAQDIIGGVLGVGQGAMSGFTEGARAGPVGAGVGAIAGAGLNLVSGAVNTGFNRAQQLIQRGVQERNLNMQFGNIKLSPNSYNLSPYQATNVFASTNIF